MIMVRQTQVGRLRHVRDLGQALSRAVDLESLFTTLHVELSAALAADTFFLALYDKASGTVQVVRQADYDDELPGGTFPLGHGFTSDVIRTGRPRLIRRWSEEGPHVEVQYVSSTPGLPESSLIVPMVHGQEVLGVIAVYKYQPLGFDEDDLLLMEAIAPQAAAAIASLGNSERLNGQLRERVSELQAIVTTMADALLIIDAEGRLTGLNSAARELLCVNDTSVLMGQHVAREAWGQWPLGASEITAALEPMIARLQRGAVPAEVVVRVEPQGRRLLSFSGTPLVDAHGRLKGSILIVRDVTGRQEVEELKDEMLSVASHDLRTPVTVIRAQAQLMRRAIRYSATTLEQMDEGLASIVDETERLTRLLALLLDLSRLQAGRFDIDRRLIDIGKMARTVVDEVQTTTRKHKIGLNLVGNLNGVWDQPRLEQVLTNLLTNAIKYSPDGGAIEVGVRGEQNSVQVSVRDNGIGVAQHEAEHLFERFFRAKSTRQLEGAGLGLYICHSIVTAHGGRIWVESDGPGRGAAFCFVLPRDDKGKPSPKGYSKVASRH